MTSLYSFPTDPADAPLVASISRQHSIDAGQCGAPDPVGNGLHECLSECRDFGTKVPDQAEVESELDRVIAELSDRMSQAMRDGDRVGAEIFLDRMTAAMQSRTAEHQSRLNQRAWQRMLDADPCYFCGMGEHDRENHG